MIERVLPVGEEVEAMLTAIEDLWKNYRAADRSTKVVEVRGLNDRTGLREITEGIETLRAVGLECGAVKSVRAGFGGSEHAAAAALSVLGGEGGGEDLKLFGGVGRGNEAVGAIDAHVAGQTVDDDGIGSGPSATEREAVDA